MNTKQAKYTGKTFAKEFPDNDACLEWLKNKHYPNGVECPICKTVKKHYKVAKRPCYKCECGHEYYPTAGTIFHKSTTPLTVWFEAMFWMATTRSGHSAKELQRRTGVTYKTAWRMFKQIRTLLDENAGMFTNEVEIDETYIGGKRRGDNQGRPAEGSHKVPVIGIAQRNGKVSVKAVANVKRSTVMPLIAKNVTRRTMIYTDEYSVYDKVEDAGFGHIKCNHAAGEYVVGSAHTNTIEGFWSLVKRGIGGVYHAVSPKYLQSYLNEYQFRYNHRLEERPMFLTVLNQIQ
jgi:transposase-like protein